MLRWNQILHSDGRLSWNILFLSPVLNIAHISKQKISGKKTIKVELFAAQKQNHLFIFQTSTSQYLHASILALFGRSGKFYWSFLFHFGDFHCSCLMKPTARLSSSSSSSAPVNTSLSFVQNVPIILLKHREGSRERNAGWNIARVPRTLRVGQPYLDL